MAKKKKKKEQDAISNYIRFFKQSKEFNIVVFGAMMGVCFTCISIGILFTFDRADVTPFLSYETFGSIVIGYLVYAQIKKLEGKRK
jgi:hypothetical protein